MDAKPKVDPFLHSAELKDTPGGNFIAFAMEKYERAAQLRGQTSDVEVERLLYAAGTDVDQAEFRMNEAAKKAADAAASKPAKKGE